MKKQTVDKLMRAQVAVERELDAGINACTFFMVASVFGWWFWIAGAILWQMVTGR